MKESMIKAFIPFAAAGLFTWASYDTVQNRAKDYMVETNRTQAELEELTNTSKAITIQSRLDSLAYRDIFNSTQAVRDSVKVAEFNKIASRMRPDTNGNMWDAFEAIDDRLISEGISIKELDNIKQTDTPLMWDHRRVNRRQHYADDWAYRKFFEKIGIMNGIAKKCDEVSEKIRP